uniref:STP1 protein n=1 Tax=Strongyloides stercoralis TaxID=6248 RepID=A0A0K0EIE0_STRER
MDKFDNFNNNYNKINLPTNGNELYSTSTQPSLDKSTSETRKTNIYVYIICGIVATIIFLIVLFFILKKCLKKKPKGRINNVKIADKKRAKATKNYLKQHKSLVIPIDKNGLPKKNKVKNNDKQKKQVNANKQELEKRKTDKKLKKSKENINNLINDNNLLSVDKLEKNKDVTNILNKKELKSSSIKVIDKYKLDDEYKVRKKTFEDDNNALVKMNYNLPIVSKDLTLCNTSVTSPNTIEDKTMKNKATYNILSKDFSNKNQEKKCKCQIHNIKRQISTYTLYGNNEAWVKNEEKTNEFSFQISTESFQSSSK